MDLGSLFVAAGRYGSGLQQPALTTAAVAARAQAAQAGQAGQAGQATTVLHRADNMHPGGRAALAPFWPHNDAHFRRLLCTSE